MKYDKKQIENLKKTVFDFHKKISEMNTELKRKFTMDGHMIGSVGEVFASYYYGIDLYESGHKLYDGAKAGKKIQIKITQRDRVEVKGVPEYLLVLKLVWSNNKAEVLEVYNGPGKVALPNKRIDNMNESSLSINKLSSLSVDPEDKIHSEHPICSLKEWKKHANNGVD